MPSLFDDMRNDALEQDRLSKDADVREESLFAGAMMEAMDARLEQSRLERDMPEIDRERDDRADLREIQKEVSKFVDEKGHGNEAIGGIMAGADTIMSELRK